MCRLPVHATAGTGFSVHVAAALIVWRSPGEAGHCSVFVPHAIVLLAAALFRTFVRLGRLF
jgi:hypothetical protein